VWRSWRVGQAANAVIASEAAQSPRSRHYYLERGRAEAAALGVPCNWRLVVVPGVGHDGMRMSAFAAAHWFDGGTGGVSGDRSWVGRPAETDERRWTRPKAGKRR